MNGGARAARALWLGWWSAMRRYHRFEVRNLEAVERGGAALIVGYHGRPVARDLCMLQTLIYERTGALPYAVMHATYETTPVLRWLIEGGGFVTGDGSQMENLVKGGTKIMVTPGGTREGCRSFRHRYRVDWGGRLGYLRLALKYKLPILPTASSGVDDTYIGLNDGYAWGKRLRIPGRMPAWIGVGPLGLWPLSPPYPVKITLHVGAPIDFSDDKVDPNDRQALLALHARVTGAVQSLLDEARA